MLTTVHFTVRGIPAPQGSMVRTRWGMRHSNPRTLPWRQLVAYAAQDHAPRDPLRGPMSVTLRFVLPRPKSLPKRAVPHVKKPDIDKLIRSVCDALSGVVWHDDAQVVAMFAVKAYEVPGDPPGVEITIQTEEGK